MNPSHKPWYLDGTAAWYGFLWALVFFILEKLHVFHWMWKNWPLVKDLTVTVKIPVFYWVLAIFILGFSFVRLRKWIKAWTERSTAIATSQSNGWTQRFHRAAQWIKGMMVGVSHQEVILHADIKPDNVSTAPLNVDPPSSEIPDPSDKKNSVSNLLRQDRAVDTRWDPKGDKGEPDVLMLPEFDGALFSRLRFHLTVVENEFNFVFKLMSEKGSSIHGNSLFSVMDEVALDFRLRDGALMMYYREHKSHIVVPLRPTSSTDFDVSIHVMSIRGRMVLQVNGGGTVLYGVPIKAGVRRKAALITWSRDRKPYHMSFTEIRYATSTG